MPHRKIAEIDEVDTSVRIDELQQKLKKKTEDLTRTRQRLNKARARIQKLKEIVNYQRNRIIKLTQQHD